MEAHAARVLDDARALSAISTLVGLARLLPERDPHQGLYAAALGVLRSLDHAELWPPLLVRWELQLLGGLGFGLDLTECAATGADVDLAYVSPRSGRAVSRDAGQPYCSKLLKLPAFLLDDEAAASNADILSGLALTGHFLERDVLAPHGLVMPQARERLISLLGRTQAAARSA
jgi:DNA repair protein RecO (recombination protein O)